MANQCFSHTDVTWAGSPGILMSTQVYLPTLIESISQFCSHYEVMNVYLYINFLGKLNFHIIFFSKLKGNKTC